MARTAGYKEIPQHLIDEAERRVGLEPGMAPPIHVKRGNGRGTFDVCPCCDLPVITVPRRERKSRVPYVLRHEMAHFVLGHFPQYVDGRNRLAVAVAARRDARGEIEAIRFTEGRIDRQSLASCVLYVVKEYGLPLRMAALIVVDEARTLGVPMRVLRAFVGVRKERRRRNDAHLQVSAPAGRLPRSRAAGGT